LTQSILYPEVEKGAAYDASDYAKDTPTLAYLIAA